MYQSDFCDVIYLSSINIVHVKWKKFCKLNDYRNPLRHAIEIMKENKNCHYVADTRNGFENEDSDTQWVFNEFIPQTASTNCKYIFFIIDKDDSLKEELESQSVEFNKFFEVKAFFSLNEIKEFLANNTNHFLDKKLDYLTPEITNTCDELSLWASAFGLLLLDNFPIKNYKNYLDIACGTGFPLIEIASRIGPHCKAVGIDIWTEAIQRTQQKIKSQELNNITVIEKNAEKIEFENDHFDLITSNLGINNFDKPLIVLGESYRVLKPDGIICATTNITGTFDEFYNIFRKTLVEFGFEKYISQLDSHINHRGTEEDSLKLFEDSGFEVVKVKRSEYQMRFFNGSAFLNHPYIIIGFIDSWRNMFDEDDKLLFFAYLEQNLNIYATQYGELRLTIPMLYIEAKKIK